ncbi:MAG: radical SAM/SPASM domain-containing protein [Bacteroidota bacterium]
MSMRFYSKILKRIARIKMQRRFGTPSLPYKYTFITTNACNSMCTTCGVWKIYRETPELLKTELANDEIAKVIDSVRDSVLWLNFTGGEVTLKKNLPDVIRHAYDVCPDLSMINVPMNGLKTNRTVEFIENFVPHCKKTKTYVTLSLDMLGKDYEKTRGIDGFDQVMETFGALQDLEKRFPNFEVNFQLTVSQVNGMSSLKTFDFIANKSGLPIVTFAQEASLFYNKEMEIDCAEKSTVVRDALLEIERRYPMVRLESLMPKIHLNLSQEFFRTGKSPMSCSSSYSTITVDPYGAVMACPFYSDKLAGNVRDAGYDLKAILEGPKATELREWVSTCRACWINCEAIPSIMENFPVALAKAAKQKLLG